MATAGTDGRSFGVAVRKLEGGYGVLLRLGVEFFELRFSNIALTFSFNLPTVEHDTDPEDMATATAGTDRRSFGVAARKLEGGYRMLLRLGVEFFELRFSNIALTIFFQFTHCRARYGHGGHGHGDSGHRRAFFRRRRSEIRRWVRCASTAWHRVFRASIFEHRAHFFFQFTHCRARHGPGEHGHGDSGHRQAFFRRRRSEIGRRSASTLA